MESAAILDFALWKKTPGFLGGTGGLIFQKKRSIEVKKIVKPS